jgi:L-aspartate oxidase
VSGDRPGPGGEAGPVTGLEVVVVGSGVAGLSAAVRAAALGMRVGVVTKAALEQATTRWAQGGVAAALSGDEDSVDLHLSDTLAAGAGLCDVDSVRVLVAEGPGRVGDLIALGAEFDRGPGGRLSLSREGGHSVARVLHSGGAATGAEVERALVAAVRGSAAALLEGWFATDLLVEGGRCAGVSALDPQGRRRQVRVGQVVLATGGAGQLFSVTTNPAEATGDGVAMALRAGVPVADVEFVQFHPTALHHPAMPRPLLSEALRGHGALLRDDRGERFVDELLPRDAVSRAMAARMRERGVDHLWLDATALEGFDQRFPTIAAQVRAVGLDPASDWLPIAPAAHYVSGGVVTDLDGASALPGMWACGEVACTGVHGANRLASNSLLEGMVFGPRVAEAISEGRDGPRPTGALRALLDGAPPGDWVPARPVGGGALPGGGAARRSVGGDRTKRRRSVDGDSTKRRLELQRAMTEGAGVLRDAESLAEAGAAVARQAEGLAAPERRDPCGWELSNLVRVAAALLAAAGARTESRGAHTRLDFPTTDPGQRVRLVHGGVAP